MNVRRVNRIVFMLYDEMKALSDEDRDIPMRWNVMHMFSSAQLAKILALRRGLDAELAAIAAALHDIAIVETKSREKHSELAEQHVRRAIEKYNNGPWTKLPKVTKEEEEILVNAIRQHSDKGTCSNDPFVELIKDIDSLDRYLHGVQTEGPYLERSRKVLEELGISR